MPFAYYQKLSRRDRAIYDASDRLAAITLPQAELLRPLVAVLREGLEADRRDVVESASGRLVRGMTELLKVEPVEVKVLAVRPTLTAAELHGLYTRPENGRARIQVWTRTAAFKRVVAFRTFLRTLLHEVCHHLDYTLLALADSFHTQGFFSRESSLFKQLVPEPVLIRDRARARSRP